MRIRRYLIGLTAGLVSALVFSSVASADVTGNNLTVSLTPAKQNKKVRGPVNIFFQSDDVHVGDVPCPLGTANSPSCYSFPASTQSLITFPKDLKFTSGNIPGCQLSQIVGQSTAGARAACARSIVGAGAVTQAVSDGRRLNGVLTEFNGVPSGGSPTVYIHTDIPGVATKPILSGVIHANTITTQIPPVQGTAIDLFSLNIFGKRVVGTNKKTGKKTTYASIRCSTGKWNSTQVVTFQGGKTETGTAAGNCKQKK
jgi:hypothetical protein